MQQLDPFVSVAILFAAALIGGLLAHRLKQPIIIGYLIVGVVIGPYALGLIGDLDIIEAAATIGVTLLMFTLGMETSIGQMREVGRVGVLGGILQIVVTAVIGILAGINIFHWAIPQSIIFGLVISLSSTAVCLKIMMDRGELSSVQGRIMISILILQDISVIFVSLIIPLIRGDTSSLPLNLALSIGKVSIFVVVTIVIGRWVLPWLLGGVGGFRSRELFLLTILVLCLGAAVSTQIVGLSIIFGAFVVGLVLRETRFIHQALAEITPLRDIFVSLFFVSLGMLVNPSFVANNWPAILLVVVIIILIKILAISGIVLLFGYSIRTAILTGIGLFQIGEFGFIIAQRGFEIGIVSDQFYSLIVTSAVITMLMTPMGISLSSHLYHRIAMRMGRKIASAGDLKQQLAEPPKDSDVFKPIIIAGYGEVGQSIAESLHEVDIPYIVIDDDPERISAAKTSKHPRIYGDATNINVLSKANLKHASALVIAYPDPMAVITTVKLAQLLNPALLILARASREDDIKKLRKLGIKELVIPEREAGYKFVKILFKAIGLEQEERRHLLSIARKTISK